MRYTAAKLEGSFASQRARQLRGECGERQVKKHDTAMVHGNGGVLSAQASVVLGTSGTL